MNRLNNRSLANSCRDLSREDKHLRFVFENYGVPPLWDKPETFSTLIDIILGQQVSLASAKACYEKLETLIGVITPKAFLDLGDEELRSVGFSRQKTGYGRAVANAMLDRDLDLAALRRLSDKEVKIELERIKGIGSWSSDIYLLMAMLRPDVMPKGDLALQIAWQKLAGLKKRPDADAFLELSKKWKPLRSVAARLLWHYYLSEVSSQNGT